jgi:8-oxo-dGTP diphosphatase
MPELAFPRQTSRLLLRLLGPEDREAIHRMYSDWSVAQWLSRLPWPFTPESADTFIADAQSDLSRGAAFVVVLIQQAAGAFVGTVSLRLPALDADAWTEDRGLGILGYAITPEQQGNGFASEAAASMVELAFTILDLQRLRATVLQDNIASRRVLERLQFRLWRADVREVPRYGGPARLGNTFVLDRADWRSGKSS